MKSLFEKLEELKCDSEKTFNGYSIPLGPRFYFTENAIGLMLVDPFIPRIYAGKQFCEVQKLFEALN